MKLVRSIKLTNVEYSLSEGKEIYFGVTTKEWIIIRHLVDMDKFENQTVVPFTLKSNKYYENNNYEGTIWFKYNSNLTLLKNDLTKFTAHGSRNTYYSQSNFVNIQNIFAKEFLINNREVGDEPGIVYFAIRMEPIAQNENKTRYLQLSIEQDSENESGDGGNA